MSKYEGFYVDTKTQTFHARGGKLLMTYHDPEFAEHVENLLLGSEWRPIETAPKDGTAILVYNDDGYVYQARYAGTLGWRFAIAYQHEHECGCYTKSGDEPTHWMPKPEQPEVTE